MDGDDLEESEPSEPKSLAEIFSDAFPYYLAMGMSYDEFWRGNPSLVRDYRKAYDIKRHERNNDMWMLGRYFFMALHSSALLVGFPEKNYKPPKDGGYLDRPLPITEKEAEEQERQREQENFKEYLKRMESSSARELERRKKAEKEVKDNAND